MIQSCTLSSIHNMKSRGFFMAKQPIVTGDIQENPILSGFELLARLRPSGYPMIMPDVFMPALSAKELINLDCLAFVTATEQVLAYKKEIIVFNFNCSVKSLFNAEFVAYVLGRLSALSARDRGRLVLEITETERIDELNPRKSWQILNANVSRIAETGVRIAIDDFGCGNACLTLLRNFPISIIKYSKSVLNDCVSMYSEGASERDKIGLEIMGAIGTSIRKWGGDIIVEGVERYSDIEPAKNLSANYFQGHLFGAASSESYAVGADKFEQRIEGKFSLECHKA